LVNANLDCVKTMKHVDFREADLTAVDLSGLEEADEVDFSGATLICANFSQDLLDVINFTDADLRGSILKECGQGGGNFTQANLTGLNLIWENFTQANLTETNLTGADLTNADLTEANLTRANLTRANLTEANLTGAIFKNTIMPDGSIRSDS
jgi:uncharacterized protein YjbI with pentapeptide repeats